MIRRPAGTGNGPGRSDLSDLDRDLQAIVIEERCSFGQELRAELVEENKRLRSLGGARRIRYPRTRWLAAAAAVLLVVTGALSVPPLRASLARFWDSRAESGEVDVTPPAATRAIPDRTSSELGGTFPAGELMSDGPLIPATLPALLDPRGARLIVAEEYPEILQQAGIGGTVGVLVWVRPDGAAENPRVGSSSGVSQLDMAALRAARSLRFLPATRGGEAVGTWVEFSMRFWPNPAEDQPDPHSQALRIPLSN